MGFPAATHAFRDDWLPPPEKLKRPVREAMYCSLPCRASSRDWSLSAMPSWSKPWPPSMSFCENSTTIHGFDLDFEPLRKRGDSFRKKLDRLRLADFLGLGNEGALDEVDGSVDDFSAQCSPLGDDGALNESSLSVVAQDAYDCLESESRLV